MTDQASESPTYQGPAFFSYGFRPFFLGAALFAGVAVPLWILVLAEVGHPTFLYPARDWHVHEMVFGFLPAVITGFLLTAIPNWTDRPPIRGYELLLLFTLWLAGRLLIAIPWLTPLVSAVIDAGFLVAVAGLVWREIAVAKSWDRAPMGVLVSLLACANILFHVFTLSGMEADRTERAAIAMVMMLLTLIGGRLIPTFTGELLVGSGRTERPVSFSRYDGLSIALVIIAVVSWIVQPRSIATGWIFAVAGLANLGRLARWYGWLTWREPLVLILHVGYGWFALSLLILGGAILGIGPPAEDAVHAFTAGAVGAMTLAVMTRASLGHTGRPRHAGPLTVLIYMLINVGAVLRVFGPMTGLSTNLVM
ncbi:MAG TPA: NnrS family protein, partial [Nitrospiraceae bacterium]|nr:NnrS family protein [Nitrospiraceae bacterium]